VKSPPRFCVFDRPVREPARPIRASPREAAPSLGIKALRKTPGVFFRAPPPRLGARAPLRRRASRRWRSRTSS
jgi:hypothetical protein